LWISQGKYTISGSYRFVEPIEKIMLQYCGGFESAIYALIKDFRPSNL
jgi:hypothetical protein